MKTKNKTKSKEEQKIERVYNSLQHRFKWRKQTSKRWLSDNMHMIDWIKQNYDMIETEHCDYHSTLHVNENSGVIYIETIDTDVINTLFNDTFGLTNAIIIDPNGDSPVLFEFEDFNPTIDEVLEINLQQYHELVSICSCEHCANADHLTETSAEVAAQFYNNWCEAQDVEKHDLEPREILERIMNDEYLMETFDSYIRQELEAINEA